jgi:predicted DNA-binding transcriptional regulator AlpA
MAAQSLEPLLDAKEVTQLLRCSLPLVYKLADRGQLPCVRWECPGEGKRKPRSMVRFKQSDVIEFIEKHYASTC